MYGGFPLLLRDAIWHTTHLERFESIQRAGAVIANPEIPDAERWKASCGHECFPYVRHIGGISVFDFHGFNPVEYDVTCPMSSWRTFVPFRKDWGSSVWLQIDQTAVDGEYIAPNALTKRQHVECAHQHTLMPRIEGAVLGSIPLKAIRAAYVAGSEVNGFEQLRFQR